MKLSGISLGVAAAALLAAAPAALADGVGKEQGSILVRVHALGVIPQASADVSVIGGDIDVTNTITPEIDFSYFVTQNIALELIAASPQHTASSTALNGADLAEVRLLPPTLTAQWHFMPQSNFSPYVGAGINYTWFYDTNPKSGLDSVHIDDSFGWVVQAGFDYAISDRWFFNVDVKQVFLNTKAHVNGGAITADIDLDPTLVGVGFGYRF